MRSGVVPNVLSSLMRTASPGIVTRAIIRTVASVSGVGAGPCSELPQAVTQRGPVGAVERCAPASAPSTLTKAAAVMTTLDKFISSRRDR